MNTIINFLADAQVVVFFVVIAVVAIGSSFWKKEPEEGLSA